MDHVTDTHSIVQYFTDDHRLSHHALEVFEKTIEEGAIIIPAVVLAEIMYIADKGKITLTFDETLQKIDTYENFSIAALDLEILKVAEKIKLNLEMHDKLIVATTLYYKASLITRDPLITKSGACTTIW